MTVYRTLEGNTIPLTDLTPQEQELAAWLQRDVETNIRQCTRTQLQLCWTAFQYDSLSELRIIPHSDDRAIAKIVQDLSERLAVAAGLPYASEAARRKVRPKEWTGNPESPIYACYLSLDENDPVDPLVLGIQLVQVVDAKDGGFCEQLGKIEKTNRRELLGAFGTESQEMQDFLHKLVQTYEQELLDALCDVLKIGYWHGNAYAWSEDKNFDELKTRVRSHAFVQRLQRDIGDDVYSVIDHVMITGLHFGTVGGREGL